MIRIERSPWSWRAITAAGFPIAFAVFDTAERAAAWWETEAKHWPGCRVERVRITTTVETVHQQPVETERAA